MKRQSRPFLVEVKKRRTTPLPAAAGPGSEIALDERAAPAAPLRDHRDHEKSLSYEEAMRAADQVFGGRMAREVDRGARQPEAIAVTTPERLFKTLTTKPVLDTARPARILQNLLEVAATPEPELEHAMPDAPRRGRGRPRKDPASAPAAPAAQAATQPSRSRAKQQPVKAARPASRPSAAAVATPAAPVVAAAKPAPAPPAQRPVAATAPSAGRKPGRDGAAPGERWKRRLRHLR